MMKTNYENIAMLLQNGTSVKIYADNFSVSNINCWHKLLSSMERYCILLSIPTTFLQTTSSSFRRMDAKTSLLSLSKTLCL
jgi:hypothetical protein